MTSSVSKHDAVNTYFRLLTDGDVEGVLGLFAPGAVVLPSPMPASGPVSGRERLTELYRQMLSRPVAFRSLRIHDTASTCAVEVEAELGQSLPPAEIVDVFDIDDSGRFTRMAVYKRS